MLLSTLALYVCATVATQYESFIGYNIMSPGFQAPVDLS